MKLVILDRDGVINEDSDNYIRSVAEWIPVPGSIEAMTRLYKAGYTLTVATNQSGIGRGYYDVATLDAMHDKLRALLAEQGATLGYLTYCPHLSEDHCNCRKPKPGMLLEIAQHFGTDIRQAVVIGDSLRDWQAADAAGASYVQVCTGKGRRTFADGKLPADIPVFANLADYVNSLLGKISA